MAGTGSAPLVIVNMNGFGVYFVITPVMSTMVPGAGGFATGFSSSTCRSALLPCWFSSAMAASRVSLVAEITFTGIFSLAWPPFSRS